MDQSKMSIEKKESKPSEEAVKLSEELKGLVDKLFDALEKKQKCLDYEDKCLDKIEMVLSKAAPHIFWENDPDYIPGTYSDDEEDDLIDEEPVKIVNKKISWNKKK